MSKDDHQDRIRSHRAAIDSLPPSGRPAALADLADKVEADASLPGVARALRLQALSAARAFPGQEALIATLEARLSAVRTTQRPKRPSPPDGAEEIPWRDRMAALARKSKGK